MLKTVGNPSTRFGDQTIVDGNLIIGTAGKGIDFSATSHGSGMTSELLADYEEGIHIASITPSTSGSITLSSSGDTLSYTKIGRLVTITGYLSIQSVSSPVGYFSISLPFAIANYGEFAARSTPVVLPDNTVSANVANFVGIALDGASAVRVYLGDAAALQADSAQEMVNGGGVFFSFSYNAA